MSKQESKVQIKSYLPQAWNFHSSFIAVFALIRYKNQHFTTISALDKTALVHSAKAQCQINQYINRRKSSVFLRQNFQSKKYFILQTAAIFKGRPLSSKTKRYQQKIFYRTHDGEIKRAAAVLKDKAAPSMCFIRRYSYDFILQLF